MTFLALAILGFVVGIFSGLLGIGGGLLVIPGLLFVYPVLLPDHAPLGMKVITGMASTQSLAGSFAASITHYLRGNAHIKLAFWIGIITMVGAYLGGITSAYYPDLLLKLIYLFFLGMVLVRGQFPDNPEAVDIKNLSIHFSQHRFKILFLAVIIGYVSGLMGIGGAALLIPLMVNMLNVPIRLAIGTCAVIVLLNSVSMFVGKVHAGLVPLPDSLFLATGASLGAILGARLSTKTSEKRLKQVLIVLVTLTFLRILWALITENILG